MTISCLSPRLKQVLIEELSREGAMDELLRELEDLPECPRGVPIAFGSTKKGRGRSEYQQFISECMRAKNIRQFGQAAQAMRECAAEWRKRK